MMRYTTLDLLPTKTKSKDQAACLITMGMTMNEVTTQWCFKIIYATAIKYQTFWVKAALGKP